MKATGAGAVTHAKTSGRAALGGPYAYLVYRIPFVVGTAGLNAVFGTPCAFAPPGWAHDAEEAKADVRSVLVDPAFAVGT